MITFPTKPLEGLPDSSSSPGNDAPNADEETKKMITLSSKRLWASTLTLGLLACGAEAPDAGSSDAALDPPAELGQRQGRLSVELLPLGEGTGALQYSLTNVGDAPLRFSPADTALEGVANNPFSVFYGGQRVTYVGPRVSFAPPRDADFIELAPGESVSASVDLTQLYSLTRPGVYSIAAGARRLTPPPGGEQASGGELLAAPAISVSVDEQHVYQPSASEVDKATQPACVTSCQRGCGVGDPIATSQCLDQCDLTCNPRQTCTVAEDNALNAATALARQLIASGIEAVSDGNEYLTWFGVRTRARTDRVAGVLDGALRDIFPTQQLCLDAGAVMFAGDPGGGCRGPGITRNFNAGTNGSLGSNVAYCPDFFALSPRDQASIVAHEAVHHFGVEDISVFLDDNLNGTFEASDVDGVRDEVLVNDPVTAQNLATEDPEAAVVSAVNYQNYVLEF